MKGVVRICIFGVLLVLAGCRSESMVEADELYQENAKKIVFFENYVKNKNHKYDAEWLDYDNVSNPAIPFAQAMKVYFRDKNNENVVQEIANKYGRIDFEVSSPVFIDDKTGRQLVYFPILKGREVPAVLSIVVERDFSLMGFVVYPKREEVQEIIAEFQRYYLNFNDILSVRTLHHDEGDGSEERPKKIKEITIIGIGNKLAPPNFPCMSMDLDVDTNGGDCGSMSGKYPTNLIPPYYFDGIKFPEYGGGGGGREDYLTKEEKEELAQLENFYLGQMSEEEKKIYLSMRAYQKRIYLQSAWSSQKSASEKFPNSVYNGKGDAYRHALFSAKTTKLMGKELSERLLTAHEQKVGQHPLEKAMDLYNNDIGRNIPMHMSVWDFDSYIEKLVDEGKLRVISNLAPNGSPTTSSKLIPSNQ